MFNICDRRAKTAILHLHITSFTKLRFVAGFKTNSCTSSVPPLAFIPCVILHDLQSQLRFILLVLLKATGLCTDTIWVVSWTQKCHRRNLFFCSYRGEVQQNTFLNGLADCLYIIISLTSQWVSENQSLLEVQISLRHQIEMARIV